MKKPKTLSLLLIFCMVISLVPAVSYTSEGFESAVSDDGTPTEAVADMEDSEISLPFCGQGKHLHSVFLK